MPGPTQCLILKEQIEELPPIGDQVPARSPRDGVHSQIAPRELLLSIEGDLDRIPRLASREDADFQIRTFTIRIGFTHGGYPWLWKMRCTIYIGKGSPRVQKQYSTDLRPKQQTRCRQSG
jgi:hypothetical protein